MSRPVDHRQGIAVPSAQGVPVPRGLSVREAAEYSDAAVPWGCCPPATPSRDSAGVHGDQPAPDELPVVLHRLPPAVPDRRMGDDDGAHGQRGGRMGGSWCRRRYGLTVGEVARDRTKGREVRLPAVLPAVSRTASRFLTRCDRFWIAISPIDPENSGFSARMRSAPEADALWVWAEDARLRMRPWSPVFRSRPTRVRGTLPACGLGAPPRCSRAATHCPDGRRTPTTSRRARSTGGHHDPRGTNPHCPSAVAVKAAPDARTRRCER